MFEQPFVPLITYVIIAVTVIVSLIAFSNQKVMDDLIFYGPAIDNGQWYRFFTSGLIHQDYFHLLFNMYALYGFGSYVEYRFTELFPGYGQLAYAFLYVAALLASDLPSFNKHRHNAYYRSLGASGAVSAVIFACIILSPTMPIRLFLLPALPGFIFGFLYLLLTSYLDRKGAGHINHSAHLWGALFGIAFIIVAGIAAGQPVVSDFIFQVRHWADR
ncbi:rhomboid family intramembrane serine protease [Flaviaesturariibacter flavus]|uniref:Rhomboid family intramembrane serine protease n=1 Tax=Flaviaesturariibacter flavus TaxID=2502780 RepID=A0A4R1BH57_9BACT|nr:rhomboid family intramembrane serine protease [Flaviaesturariibacter flavus]TCJ16543.1 rhomboid family intramembrane serine protease [Flaviaesturariibacter flavus]